MMINMCPLDDAFGNLFDDSNMDMDSGITTSKETNYEKQSDKLGIHNTLRAYKKNKNNSVYIPSESKKIDNNKTMVNKINESSSHNSSNSLQNEDKKILDSVNNLREIQLENSFSELLMSKIDYLVTTVKAMYELNESKLLKRNEHETNKKTEINNYISSSQEEDDSESLHQLILHVFLGTLLGTIIIILLELLLKFVSKGT